MSLSGRSRRHCVSIFGRHSTSHSLVTRYQPGVPELISGILMLQLRSGDLVSDCHGSLVLRFDRFAEISRRILCIGDASLQR